MPDRVVFKNINEGNFSEFRRVPCEKMFRRTESNGSNSVFVKLDITVEYCGHSFNCIEIDVGLKYIVWNVWVQQLEAE